MNKVIRHPAAQVSTALILVPASKPTPDQRALAEQTAQRLQQLPREAGSLLVFASRR